MRLGLSETWLCFGLISLVLTIVGWTGWPRDQAPRSGAEPLPDAGPKPRTSLALWVLCAEYALNAFGLVQHMVFLVDFIARGLGRAGSKRADSIGRYSVSGQSQARCSRERSQGARRRTRKISVRPDCGRPARSLVRSAGTRHRNAARESAGPRHRGRHFDHREHAYQRVFRPGSGTDRN